MGTISVRYSIGKLNHTIRKVPDIFLRCRLRSKHLLHTILPSFSSPLTRYFIIGKWSGGLSNLSFFSYFQKNIFPKNNSFFKNLEYISWERADSWAHSFFSARFLERTLSWTHAFLSARFLETMFSWTHTFLSARFPERTLSWAYAFLSACFLEHTLSARALKYKVFFSKK